jgi:hypothetical protein
MQAGAEDQMVECLLSKHKMLSLNPRTTKKKKYAMYTKEMKELFKSKICMPLNQILCSERKMLPEGRIYRRMDS